MAANKGCFGFAGAIVCEQFIEFWIQNLIAQFSDGGFACLGPSALPEFNLNVTVQMCAGCCLGPRWGLNQESGFVLECESGFAAVTPESL